MRISNEEFKELILLEIGNRYLKAAVWINNKIIYLKKIYTCGVSNGVINNINILNLNE